MCVNGDLCGFGRNITFAYFHCCGKCPVISIVLIKVSKSLVMFCGKCVKCSFVIPVCPGAFCRIDLMIVSSNSCLVTRSKL